MFPKSSKFKDLSIVCLFIFLITFVGCTSPPPDESPLVTPSPPTSPIIVSTSSPPEPPSEGTGTVWGYVVDMSNQPISELDLYLAQVLSMEDEGVVVFNSNTDPHTASDSDGRFVFEDVPPGNYAFTIVRESLDQTEMLVDPNDSSRVLLVEVTAGETIDLSILRVP